MQIHYLFTTNSCHAVVCTEWKVEARGKFETQTSELSWREKGVRKQSTTYGLLVFCAFWLGSPCSHPFWSIITLKLINYESILFLSDDLGTPVHGKWETYRELVTEIKNNFISQKRQTYKIFQIEQEIKDKINHHKGTVEMSKPSGGAICMNHIFKNA